MKQLQLPEEYKAEIWAESGSILFDHLTSSSAPTTSDYHVMKISHPKAVRLYNKQYFILQYPYPAVTYQWRTTTTGHVIGPTYHYDVIDFVFVAK